MTNVIQFPSQSSRGLLARWPFLTIEEAQDPEPLPIRGRASDDGPAIEYCPRYVSRDAIDDPSIAVFWLTPCMMQISAAVLADDIAAGDGIGRFTSDRWQSFRAEACRHSLMGWPKILAVAGREGVDWTAEYLVAGILIESGLTEELEQRGFGR